MKIGPGIDIRVQDIIVKDELLLRPTTEDHVAKLAIAYKWNPSAAPHIIVQKVMNANFVRVHCHSFKALRRAGEERIRCRYIEGEEWEIRAYGLAEQSQIKDFTPQQYHDNIIIIRDALIEKNGKCAIRDLEEHTHLKKSQIHRLVQGFSDENVKELMDKGTSFTKAYETVHFVPLGDKPKVEEKKEELTKGHAPEDSSAVHPIHTSGESEDDGEVGQPEISPEGEGTTSVPPSPTKPDEGYDSSGGSLSGEEGGSTEPETPPPEPKSDGWKKGYYHPCGTFLEEGKGIVKKRNQHTCKDVLSVGLNVNHKILEMIERKETVDVKNGSISRTDWHISDSYGPFQVDDGRLEESIEKWNENKRITGLVVRALENVKQKRDNDETERLKKLGEEPLIVVS